MEMPRTITPAERAARRTNQAVLVAPSVAELAQNFTQATLRWLKAGAPIVQEPVYASRSAICEACEAWDPAGWFGSGQCKAKGCGCTRFKRWLATETCPRGKWPAASVQPPGTPSS